MNALNENLVIVIPARKNSKRLKNKKTPPIPATINAGHIG